MTEPSADRIATPAEVLDFWFVESGFAQWFARDDAFDAEIRRRFGATHAAALSGALDGWAESPQGLQALILVLDQFSRNLHRGDPAAYAADAAALALARRAVERGDDAAVADDMQRLFLYLPFMHSEAPEDQARCVALIAERTAVPDALDAAEQHYAIIRRFGRFPHRNATLGRDSTPEELAFLEQPGSGF